MYLYVLVLACLFLSLVTPGALATSVTIEHDGILNVDGKRTFLLGMYENPAQDDVLQQIKDAGFVLVAAKASRDDLDKLQRYGLLGWINTGYAIDLSEDSAKREEQLLKMVEQYADHPALLVWEVPDEALWNVWYSCMTYHGTENEEIHKRLSSTQDTNLIHRVEEMRREVNELGEAGRFKEWEALRNQVRALLDMEPIPENFCITTAAEREEQMARGFEKGYSFLKTHDPAHPIWMNHAPRNSIEQLAAFGKAADIVGCDIYPVPSQRTGHSDLVDTSLSSVGAYTERMQASAPRKPVWMVLQGFGWADLFPSYDEQKKREQRRPTFEESRFMAYDAIVHGAKGILYWGTHSIEKDSDLWRDLMELAREISSLQPVLTAPELQIDIPVVIEKTWGSVDKGCVVMPRKVEGKLWLIVVNEWREPLHIRLTNLQEYENNTFCDERSGKEFTVASGELHLTMRGYGVYVLHSK